MHDKDDKVIRHVETALTWLKKWVPAFGLIQFAVVVAIHYFSPVSNATGPDQSYVVASGICAVCTIAISLIDVGSQLRSLTVMVKKHADTELLDIRVVIDEIFTNYSSDLFSKDLEIDIVTLHFNHMREIFEPRIISCDAKSIQLRILVVTQQVESLGAYVPLSIREGSEILTKAIKKHCAEFDNMGSQLRLRGPRLKIEMREYPYVPSFVAIRVTKPIRVCYVAFCRWKPNNYETYKFADEQYHRIYEDAASPAESDLRSVIVGMFEHCWKLSRKEKREPVVTYDNYPEKKGRHGTQPSNSAVTAARSEGSDQ
jgi:hypothetical protein